MRGNRQPDVTKDRHLKVSVASQAVDKVSGGGNFSSQLHLSGALIDGIASHFLEVSTGFYKKVLVVLGEISMLGVSFHQAKLMQFAC